MQTTLMDAKEWAMIEFSGAQLGDVRRTRRLVEVAARLAENPRGTLPGTFPRWSDLKAAYGLLSNEQVTHGNVMDPHWARTRQACQERGEYLLVEDTTELDFTSHQAAEGLGRIGNDGGRGLYLGAQRRDTLLSGEES